MEQSNSLGPPTYGRYFVPSSISFYQDTKHKLRHLIGRGKTEGLFQSLKGLVLQQEKHDLHIDAEIYLEQETLQDGKKFGTRVMSKWVWRRADWYYAVRGTTNEMDVRLCMTTPVSKQHYMLNLDTFEWIQDDVNVSLEQVLKNENCFFIESYR